MKKLKAAVYDPYLDTIGGGEVYTASVAECLLNSGYEVDILFPKASVLTDIKKYLGIDLTASAVNKEGYRLLQTRGNLRAKYQLSRGYNLFFYLSDGSIPFLFSQNNILHFQVPFTGKSGSSFHNRIKLINIDQVVVNSAFTKQFIDREYAVDSKIIYPPVNIKPRKTKKEKLILSVARFTNLLHNKRQDSLLTAFIKLLKAGANDWRLILVGSNAEGKKITDLLKKRCGGYPVKIITSATHKQVEAYYSRASIFWHAAGFQVDENLMPEAVEHFGIATVEAMNSGCVPLVINKGGQKEIVENNVDGYLWDTIDELVDKTLFIIRNNQQYLKLQKSALATSQKFSKKVFNSNFQAIIKQP